MVWSEQLGYPLIIVDDNGNEVVRIDDTGVHVLDPDGDNYIDILPVDPDDLSPDPQPVIKFNSPPRSAATIAGTYDNFEASGIRIRSGVEATSGRYGDIQIDSDGIILFASVGSGPPTTYTVSLDPLLGFFSTGPLLLFGENQWNNLFLNNGWGNGTVGPQFRKMSDGMIQLRGWIQNGTTVANTTVATLPVGYRPLTGQDHYFICAKPNQNAIQATLDVQSTGAIRVVNISNQGAAATASISLDAIRFPYI